MQSLPPGDVYDALYLTTIVAGLLEVNLQVVLQVLLVLLILDVIQENGTLRRATEGLKCITNISLFTCLQMRKWILMLPLNTAVDLDFIYLDCAKH